MAGAPAEPRIFPLFATPVLIEPWREAERFNEELKSTILARSESDAGVRKSNLLGWQSGTDLDSWGGEAARRLRDHVAGRCAVITGDVAGRPLRWLAEMWANISQAGASNQTHAHPGSYWSAVYYVDDGYAAADEEAGGELVLIDPRFPTVRMAAPDLRYRGPDGSRDHHEVPIRPRTGQIVLFPAWLQHAVRPYAGHGRRISIAINLSAMVTRAPDG